MRLIHYIVIFITFFALTGCGFSSEPQKSQSNNTSIVTGPIAYDISLSKVRKKQFSASVDYVSTEKQKISTDFSPIVDGLFAIGAILAPEAVGVVITLEQTGFDYWNANYSSDPTGASSIAPLQAQIAQLSNQLLSTDTFLAMLAYNQNTINAGSAYYNYLTNLANIMVYANNYQNPHLSSTLSSQNVGNIGQNPLISGSSSATLYGNLYNNLVDNNLTQTAQSAAKMYQISQLISARANGANQAAPATIMNTISGSVLSPNPAQPTFINVQQASIQPITAPPTQAQQGTITSNCDTGGDLPGLLQCLYGAFYYTYISNTGTNGAPPNLSNEGNVTNLANAIDTYNNIVMMIYLQSLTAMQATYQIESNVNILNYNSYVNCVPNAPSVLSSQGTPINAYQQIAFVENNDMTYFSMPQCDNNTSGAITNATAKFINAQENLAMYFARRMNGLYAYIMNFIISDPLVNGQAYVAPSPSSIVVLDYNISIIPQGSLYNTIPTTKFTNLPWQNLGNLNSVFYQYPGIGNIYYCNNLYQITFDKFGNISTPPCSPTPVASQDMNGSYYDGISFSLYAPSTGEGNFTLTNTLNSSLMCDQENNTSINNSTLMCTKYSANNITPFYSQQLSVDQIGSLQANGNYPSYCDSGNYNTIYIQGTLNPDSNNSYSVPPIPLDSNSSTFTSLSNTPYTNNLNNAVVDGWGNRLPTFTAGGYGINCTGGGTYAFQINLPSNIVFPYVYQANINPNTASDGNQAPGFVGSYACPSFGVASDNSQIYPPGIKSCITGLTATYAYMTVTDTYGNVFTFQDSLYVSGEDFTFSTWGQPGYSAPTCGLLGLEKCSLYVLGIYQPNVYGVSLLK